MNTTRRWMSTLVLGLMFSGAAISADAAGYFHCPHPDEPNRCYPMYAEEAQFPLIPDPGPYEVVDIDGIADQIMTALDVVAEPDPEPWIMFDMENQQIVV